MTLQVLKQQSRLGKVRHNDIGAGGDKPVPFPPVEPARSPFIRRRANRPPAGLPRVFDLHIAIPKRHQLRARKGMLADDLLDHALFREMLVILDCGINPVFKESLKTKSR